MVVSTLACVRQVLDGADVGAELQYMSGESRPIRLAPRFRHHWEKLTPQPKKAPTSADDGEKSRTSPHRPPASVSAVQQTAAIREIMCERVKNKKYFVGHGIYIGRPSVYGNPFSHKEATLAEVQVETRHEAVMRFASWLVTGTDTQHKRKPAQIHAAIRSGKLDNRLPLICWCAPEACHGHVLVEVRTPEQLDNAIHDPEAFLRMIEEKILKPDFRGGGFRDG